MAEFPESENTTEAMHIYAVFERQEQKPQVSKYHRDRADFRVCTLKLPLLRLFATPESQKQPA